MRIKGTLTLCSELRCCPFRIVSTTPRHYNDETDLDLSNGQIQEGHSITNFDDRFRSNATHRRSESSVELEDGELVEQGGSLAFGEVGVGDDLLLRRRLNFVPITERKIVSTRCIRFEDESAYIFCPLARSERYRLKRMKKDCISASNACSSQNQYLNFDAESA